MRHAAETTILATALAVLLALPAHASDGVRFVADVPGQFRALTERAEALGVHIDGTPDPSACRHYQGIARVDGADGTPFFLVTRSGNTPLIDNVPAEEVLCNDSDNEKRNGNLIVFKMGSREKHGERMRSNRLERGVHVDGTLPPAEDAATIYFTVVEGGLVFHGDDDPLLPKVYQHPGGMQVVGHMLALASETPRPFPEDCLQCFLPDPQQDCTDCLSYQPAGSPTLIMFFKVSDPENPRWTSQFVPVLNADNDPLPGADGIAITPLPLIPGEPGPRYLMAVTGGFEPDDPIYFYRSTSHADGLESMALAWDLVGQTPDPNSSNDAHQSLHFLRQGTVNGDLYLACARGHAEIGPFFEDNDRLDLYQVNCDTAYCEPGEEVHLTVVENGRRLTPRPSTGGTLLASLAAATGFHVTPSGELLFYATEHDNVGPSDTLNIGEWRHIDVVRENSPTLLPTALVNGPYEVDEGSSVSLSGSAEPAVTRAFIELFHEVDFGGDDFSTFYPVVDHDDFDLDDFDDFAALEPAFLFSHHDKARSWKWFAPVGCSIEALDHEQGVLDEVKTLVGNGFVKQDRDLSEVLNDGGTDDINQEIDAINFLDCAEHYAQPVALEWDLDRNGTHETAGSPVTFDAGALDGPAEVAVPARAQHPSGGPAGLAQAALTVRNVPPAISPLRIEDGAGNVVGIDVPFVLTGVPVTALGEFADPGLPDRQTATFAWGDGVANAQNVFTSFDEAFSDGMGAAVHTHTYALAGAFAIELSVTDDDGGTDSQTAAVDVLTPSQAVSQVIDMLEDVIAGTTNTKVRKNLEKAHKALAGNANGNNGALNKIQNGNVNAAIAFLKQAIGALEAAQAGGADVGVLIALLEQVANAL